MPPLLPRRSAPRRRLPDLLLLGVVLLLAAAFRLHGLTWDDGTLQHPDERFLAIVGSRVAMPASLGDYFDPRRSTLTPYTTAQDHFAYGQLPLTLTRLVAERVGMGDYSSVYLVGRALAVAAELGTIVFSWLLARRALGVRHAHLAALLLALCVLDIQLAHFFTVDPFVALFAAGCLSWGQRAWQRESLADAALAGLMAGLATACKISAASLLPVLALALLWPRAGRPSRQQLLDGATAFGVALLGAFVAFRVAEPYAFVGPAVWNLRLNPQWFADKLYWAQVSSGAVDVPYMIQWAGTPAYAFVLQAIVRWGMGPALAMSALAGAALAVWRLARGQRRERELVLVLGWALLNLAYFGGQFAKFLRYLLPAYFALAILAAYALLVAVDAARARRPGNRLARRAGQALLATAVAATALWALAFSRVYTQPHSRVQASEWIYATIPAGRTLAVEHWDDRLPLPLPGAEAGRYSYVELALYDPETPVKRQRLIAALDRADYVVLASRRLVDSIPRLPERFPLATTYYRLLLSGELGFERAARFQVTPGLGPFSVDDGRAQEDFTVYDHPTVEVWAKRADYSARAVHDVLGRVPIEHAVSTRAIDGDKGALLLSPRERQTAEAGGSWAALFQRDSLANRLAVPVWLLAAELLALSAVPLLWTTLRFLPDRGFGASKILGLAVVAYAAWLPASLRLAPFDRATLVLAWLGLTALSGAAGWRERAALAAWLRREARLLLTVEAVFLAGFALFLWLRAANPDLWHPRFGGEKPMNFAYLNATVKSDYFPPYDPWFAGGIINYYYFGLVLVAALIKLTGILPEVAFNLAQPTIYGALCAGAFSLAFAITLPARGHLRRGSAYVAGFAGVLLLAVLGNLDAGLQVADQLGRLGAQLAPRSGGIARLAAGLLAVLEGARFPPLDFWRSTRFIGPEEVPPIHEFPYFTFLYGDLHAHQLALPLTVAVLLVALNLARGARAAPGRVAWAPVAWAALLLGLLRATNTWDFPTYALAVGLSLALGYLGPSAWRSRASIAAALRGLAGSGLAIAVLSQLLVWPYLQRYQLFYTGVDPVRARTAIGQYLTIHGLQLYVSGSLLAWYLARAWRTAAARRQRELLPEPGYYGVILPIAGRGGLPLATPAAWLVLAGAGAGAAQAAAGYPTRGLILVGVGAAAAACLAHWRRPARAFQALLLGAALLATLVPEVAALQGDVGRMNTVFKFYLQAWVLMAVAAAAALGWLVGALGRARGPWLAVAALLASAAACYPLFATQGKVGLRFADLPLTLDGMAFMDRAAYRDAEHDLDLPGDAAAIRWLRDNVAGSPPILEGRAPVYRWGSRVAVYTGLPTVLGWDVHEDQQRAGYRALLQERAADVERAYASPDAADALAVVRRYGVRWVYVGGLERAYYPAGGLAKFGALPELRLAYDRDGVQIYEVLP